MKNLLVYDASAEVINRLADANDTSAEEIVDMFLEFLEDVAFRNDLVVPEGLE